MEKLLADWGFDEMIINNFIEHDIEIGHLSDLTDEQIKELVIKIGDRLKLRKCIQAYLNNEEQDKVEAVSSSKKRMNNNNKSDDYITVSEILKEYAEGRKVLEHYSKERNITPILRGYIVRCLVDYYLERFSTISQHHFEHISEKIVKEFPCEDKDVYFRRGELVNNKRLHNRGKLVDRYYNFNRNDSLKSKKKKANDQLIEPSKELIQNSGDHQKTKNILRFMLVESDDTFGYWKSTFELRRSEFLGTTDGSKIEDVLNGWPILKTSFAPKLIALDFEAIYPNKSQQALEKWPIFVEGIKKLFHEVKDVVGLKIVKLLTNPNLSPETFEFHVLYVLPFILTPSVRVDVKRELVKPTIIESRDAFIIKVNTINDLQVKLDKYTKDQKTRGLPVQPLIIGVGIDEINEVFVICDDIKYKCSSVVAALIICFQVHIVFRSAYSVECVHIWTLIQKYVFSIDTEFDWDLTNVSSLLATLNSN